MSKHTKNLMKYYITLIFLLIFFFTNAQEKYEYFGAIKLNGNDKTVITYIWIDSINIIKYLTVEFTFIKRN